MSPYFNRWGKIYVRKCCFPSHISILNSRGLFWSHPFIKHFLQQLSGFSTLSLIIKKMRSNVLFREWLSPRSPAVHDIIIQSLPDGGFMNINISQHEKALSLLKSCAVFFYGLTDALFLGKTLLINLSWEISNNGLKFSALVDNLSDCKLEEMARNIFQPNEHQRLFF